MSEDINSSNRGLLENETKRSCDKSAGMEEEGWNNVDMGGKLSVGREEVGDRSCQGKRKGEDILS